MMMICDAHADTLYSLAEDPHKNTDVTQERLLKGGVSLQTLAMYTGPENNKEKMAVMLRGMLNVFAQFKKDGWLQADDPSEAVEGEVRVMLSVEGCEVFEPGLHTIAQYRALGVRMAAVTWNFENALAYPAASGSTEGLKPYGLEAVREMQRLGIAVDVSHLNVRGFYDILHKTEKPPLASHSCCAALKDHPRNLTDAQLKDLFTAGGYVGVNFYPRFLSNEACDLDTVVDHMDHMHQIGGAGMVGFGSDFDGIETKPAGLSDPSDFPALLGALERRGYSGAVLEGIAGRNFIRYYSRL
jgi:membrane dipeptidase